MFQKINKKNKGYYTNYKRKYFYYCLKIIKNIINKIILFFILDLNQVFDTFSLRNPSLLVHYYQKYLV